MLDKAADAEQVGVAAKVEAVAQAVKALIRDSPPDLHAEARHRLEKALKTLERQETYVAVAGLFKAGKSTLINRLARWQILPSGDLPETGAPALLRRRKPQAAWAVDRQDGRREVAATPETLARHTSIYTEAGVRRSTSEMAAYVEIHAPELDVSENTVLLDLPGLRDTNEMDQVALEMAIEADVIFWVFRSEPAFSEQDTQFLSYLIDACGAHLIQFVLNVVQPDKSAKAWRAFNKQRLPVHRTALTKASSELGLGPEKAAELCVVDASRMRRALFGVTFGGRQMFKRLRSLSRRSDEQVKRARFVRVANALSLYAAWLGPELLDAEQRFDEALARFDAYQARLRRREELVEAMKAAVAAAFSGLEGEIRSAGDAASGYLTSSSFSVGAETSGPLVQGATSAISTRAIGLVASLTAIANDPELNGLTPRAAEDIVAAFALSRSSGTAQAQIAHSVEHQVGSIRLAKPKLSFGRVFSWLKGEDNEVAAVIDATRSTLRSAAAQAGSAAKKREAQVRATVLERVQTAPIAPEPKPDPTRVATLRKCRTALDNAKTQVQRQA